MTEDFFEKRLIFEVDDECDQNLIPPYPRMMNHCFYVTYTMRPFGLDKKDYELTFALGDIIFKTKIGLSKEHFKSKEECIDLYKHIHRQLSEMFHDEERFEKRKIFQEDYRVQDFYGELNVCCLYSFI